MVDFRRAALNSLPSTSGPRVGPNPARNQAGQILIRLAASIRELAGRGLLKNYDEDETVCPDNLKVTKKFAGAVFATRSDFERFWDAFPAFGPAPAGGEKLALKTAAMPQVRDLFEDRVQTPQDHEKMMQAIEWAQEHQPLSTDIETFLKSEYSRQIQKEVKDSPGAGVPFA